MSDDLATTRIEDALFDLLATTDFGNIRLGDLAAKADVSLADLRRAYESPLDVLSGFARRIDVAVLEGIDPAMAGEPVKDRLFDAAMRRFDLLAPHRAGLAGLERSARRDPRLALHLARMVVGSQAWLLEASGVSAAGPRGRAKAVAMAAALARVVPVFLAEAEPGLPKTMAALDGALDRLGRVAERVGKAERAATWMVERCRSIRRGTRPAAEAPAAEPPAEPIDPSI